VGGHRTRVPINFCWQTSQTTVYPKADFFTVKPDDPVEQGQLLASGRLKLGDHVFVDKVRYNFFPPRRGDVIVFDTKTIRFPGVHTDSFYIKRLVGLPGDTLALDPPYLEVNGRPLTQPYPFWRLLNDAAFLKTRWDLFRAVVQAAHPEQHIPEWAPGLGRGYELPAPAQAPAFLAERGERRTLEPDQFLPMGDNTFSSLDGRYFGPVRLPELIGPAFMVYWPFTPRWGRTR